MKQIVQQLCQKREQLNILQNQVTLGFDGFIDTIIRLVKENNIGQSPVLFQQMEELSNYIGDRAGKNFSLEMHTTMVKLGGNMPIMANALARLGLQVNCIGALGFPDIEPVFKNTSQHCKLYSFAPPGITQAIEFKDGKMILCQMEELNAVDWPLLKARLGIDVLIQLMEASALFGMLNWGELINRTGIWSGIVNEVLPFCTHNKNRIFFVDLADCTKRDANDIKNVLTLLQQFAGYGKLILGLNHNEASKIYQVLFSRQPQQDTIDFIGRELFPALAIHTLILHNKKEAIVFTGDELIREESFYVAEPKILTGAGDNFNAGFCVAQLLQMNLRDSLLLAHFVSAYYVKNGVSADWNTLINEMELTY